jgi:hypothetical protein
MDPSIGSATSSRIDELDSLTVKSNSNILLHKGIFYRGFTMPGQLKAAQWVHPFQLGDIITSFHIFFYCLTSLFF